MTRILMLAGFLVAAGMATAQDGAVRLAKIVEVQVDAQDQTRQFFGDVAAKDTVDLAFQVAGQIVELPIIEGQPVAKGELVAQLDLEPFELALDQARVQREQALRNLERFQKLEGSTVSQVSVDDAQTQFDLAVIAERNAARSLNDAQLQSPFDALVASRNVANFSTIAAGTPVTRLHDMSELRVEIDVPEILFQQGGEEPDLDLHAQFPFSDKKYPLERREFNAETSPVGQTFRITLGMPPPDDLVVLPGSSVTVFATLRGGTSKLHIPTSAVITTSDGATQVMVFDPAGADEGTVSAVPVSVVPDATGKVIVTEGLEAGQEVIASGAHMLSDGERVRRFTGFTK